MHCGRLSLVAFNVESIAYAVAEEHESEHYNHNCGSGQECEIGVVEQDVAVVFFHHGTP